MLTFKVRAWITYYGFGEVFSDLLNFKFDLLKLHSCSLLFVINHFTNVEYFDFHFFEVNLVILALSLFIFTDIFFQQRCGEGLCFINFELKHLN